MSGKTLFFIVVSICASALLVNRAPAQGQTPAQDQGSSCIPAPQPSAAADGRGRGGAPVPARGAGQAQAPQARGSRDVTVTEIPGVVAAGARWTKIWQQAGNSADGIIPDKDGNVLVAQEDYDAVLKIDGNGKPSVFVTGAKGIGSVSMDRQGGLYGAH